MSTAAPASPLIRIDSEVTRRMRQHARAHMQTEVCGVLIGRLCDGVIEIEAPIEAFNASQAGAHVTFTQAAWETIYKVKDKHYPTDRIVGWYHSHPGFGVFLSDHDTFIHQHFFSSPDQVAWVYDPHSDEEGCFGWVEGSIRRIGCIYLADNSGDDITHAHRQASQQARDDRAVPARPASPEAKTLHERNPKRAAPAPPVLHTRPGFFLRFAVQVKRVSIAGVHSLGRSLAPAQVRQARQHVPAETAPALPEGQAAGADVQPSLAMERDQSTKPIPSESGQ